LKTDTLAPTRCFGTLVSLVTALGLTLSLASVAHAQVTPAAGYTPPDDTPSIKVGATIFADFTYVNKPTAKDADGNTINSSSFNVARSYINITGNVSHIVAFRITPDITRESGTGSSLNGSLTFRLKYAFMQINLDDWLPKGSWVRLGIQQTPLIDYEEGIYRYRFQGTTFTERETTAAGAGFLTSSDAGVSFHTAFPGNYGEVHVGFYNGDGYSKAEANDQKALQIRVTFRPLPLNAVLRGWRVTAFYDADNYVVNAERKRTVLNTTFEHKYVNVGLDYLSANDQTSATTVPAVRDIHEKGWSLWATPKFGRGFEALLRYDAFTPDDTQTVQTRSRSIIGLAYWFPHQGSVSAALMFDADTRTFTNINSPTAQTLFVHGLIAF
jgi:hypothetical protein